MAKKYLKKFRIGRDPRTGRFISAKEGMKINSIIDVEVETMRVIIHEGKQLVLISEEFDVTE